MGDRRWGLLLAATLAVSCRAAGQKTGDDGLPQPGDSAHNAHTQASSAAAQNSPSAPSAAAPAGAGQQLLPPETYAVISGVLSWSDRSLASFSPKQRKDQALYDQLRARGVPKAQLRLLLDGAATRQAMLDATRQQAKAVPPGGTLLFYYAGHGVKADDGNAYFACYDIVAKRSAATGFSMDALTRAIGENFRGARVLLLADCCYSGALAQVAKRLNDKGIDAVSLTSADESNVSTSNWTYTMSVLSCLSGDALCDADGNGDIALAELASEVRASMKHREGQRAGFASHGVSADLAVARVAQAAELKPSKRRKYVEARVKQRWRPARVRAIDRNRRTVRLYGYADHRDVTLTAGRTRSVTFKRYPVGAALKVYWGGKVWDAKVVRTDGEFHFITYPGWPHYWDEWITSRRIADAQAPSRKEGLSADPVFEVGSAVRVEWHGDWYPAKVLERRGRRHLVHYDGYGKEWDEWVGPVRMRAR